MTYIASFLLIFLLTFLLSKIISNFNLVKIITRINNTYMIFFVAGYGHVTRFWTRCKQGYCVQVQGNVLKRGNMYIFIPSSSLRRTVEDSHPRPHACSTALWSPLQPHNQILPALLPLYCLIPRMNKALTTSSSFSSV